MAKLTLSDLSNLQNEVTAVTTINANNTTLETALEKTLSRDGTTPNQMTADLDMNSNRILNLPSPIDDNEPVRLIDLTTGVQGPPGPTGPTGPAGADGSGTGDVVGPASATDNAVVRFNGTTGKLVQNSAVTIDDTTGLIAGSRFANTGLNLEDTNASHLLNIKPGSDLTAARTLTLTTGDADRTLTLTASSSIGGTAYVSGGTDVAVADGGTGASTADAALDALGAIKAGKHTIYLTANSFTSRSTNGAAPGLLELTTNKNMLTSLDFDTATQEFAQFSIAMPKSWNEGTVTFQPVWSHAATTVNFGVVWGLAGVATSDDDAADVAFGTAQTSTDTGGTTNDIYIGPESSAITIAGTPAEGDRINFQLNRTVADGGDTLAIDARLHGIKLYITYNAKDDS